MVTAYVIVPFPVVGSPLVGVLVKPNAVIFGMVKTTNVSPGSPHAVETGLPFLGLAGLYAAVQ